MQQVEEFRHRREKLEHYSERLLMVNTELRARREALDNLEADIEDRKAHVTSISSSAVELKETAASERAEAAAAVRGAERRARRLQALGPAGRSLNPLAGDEEDEDEDDPSGKGLLGVLEEEERLVAEEDSAEQQQRDAGAGAGAGAAAGVGSSKVGAAAIERRGVQVLKRFLRGKMAQAMLEELGDLEGEELKASNLQQKALIKAGVKLDAHKIVRVVCGDKSSPTMTFHVTHGYTFKDLLIDSCDYWGVPRAEFYLRHPESGRVWQLHLDVLNEFEHLPHSLDPPTYYLCKRPAVSQADVMIYEHPNPTEKTGFVEESDMTHEAQEKMRREEESKAIVEAVTLRTTKLIKELMRFLLFVCVFLLYVYLRRRVGDQYHLSKAMRDTLVEKPFGLYRDRYFRGIDSADDFYEWARGPLADAWFGTDDEGYVALSNRWLGSVRLRQLRIRTNGNCKITQDLAAEWEREAESLGYPEGFTLVDTCYGSYDPSYASTSEYGPGAGTYGFAYISESEEATAALESMMSGVETLQSPSNPLTFLTSDVLGDISDYDGSGFIVELTPLHTRDTWESNITFYRENAWINNQTRAVVITMNWYNPSYNYVTFAQFLVEFSDTNNVRAMDKIFVLRFDRWSGSGGASDGLLFPLWLYALYQLYLQFKAARKAGFSVFYSEVFNVADFGIYGCIFADFVLRMMLLTDTSRTFLTGQAFNTLLSLDFGTFGTLSSAANGIDATIILLIMFRLFKYLEVNYELNVMWLTLKESFDVLVYYLIIYWCFLLGFVTLTHNIFGPEVFDYSSGVRAIRTLLLALLGNFNYSEVAEVSDVWAPVMFIFFIIFMRFVLFNLLLAIFIDAYEQVMKKREDSEYELQRQGKFREPFTFWHFIGVFIPSYSPSERRRAAVLDARNEAVEARATTVGKDRELDLSYSDDEEDEEGAGGAREEK